MNLFYEFLSSLQVNSTNRHPATFISFKDASQNKALGFKITKLDQLGKSENRPFRPAYQLIRYLAQIFINDCWKKTTDGKFL